MNSSINNRFKTHLTFSEAQLLIELTSIALDDANDQIEDLFATRRNMRPEDFDKSLFEYTKRARLLSSSLITLSADLSKAATERQRAD